MMFLLLRLLVVVVPFFVFVDPCVQSTLSVDELGGVRQAIVVDLVDGRGLELAIIVVMEVVRLLLHLLVLFIGGSLSLGGCE